MVWEELDSRNKDVLVAEHLMGWVWQPVPWMNNEQSMLVPNITFLKHEDARVKLGMHIYEFVPRYTTDWNAFLLVEKRIDTQGLQEKYARALCSVCHVLIGNNSLDIEDPGLDYVDIENIWSLVTATLDQRCQAALRAIGVEV